MKLSKFKIAYSWNYSKEGLPHLYNFFFEQIDKINYVYKLNYQNQQLSDKFLLEIFLERVASCLNKISSNKNLKQIKR